MLRTCECVCVHVVRMRKTYLPNLDGCFGARIIKEQVSHSTAHCSPPSINTSPHGHFAKIHETQWRRPRKQCHRPGGCVHVLSGTQISAARCVVDDAAPLGLRTSVFRGCVPEVHRGSSRNWLVDLLRHVGVCGVHCANSLSSFRSCLLSSLCVYARRNYVHVFGFHVRHNPRDCGLEILNVLTNTAWGTCGRVLFCV